MRARNARKSWASWLAPLGVVALLAAGCAPINLLPQPTGTGDALPFPQVFHGVLATGGASDIATLDPNLAVDPASIEVVRLLYDSLVTVDAHEQVELWGAQRVEVSADGLRYTFHLRPRQSFADGTPVRASDYAYGMNRALSPCIGALVPDNLFLIKDAITFFGQTCRNGRISPGPQQSGPVIQTLIGGSIAPDDGAGTLTVTLAHPAAYFLAALADSTAYALEPSVVGPDIASESWLDHLSDGPTGQGTSGMFFLSRWDRQNGRIVLKDNPSWWGRASSMRPYVNEIDWMIFANVNDAYTVYVAEQFDIGFPPPEQLAQARQQSDYHETPLLALRGVLMNWAAPPFNNLDARLAFCLAIDRDTLNQSVYQQGDLPTWRMVPRGIDSYAPQLTGPGGVNSARGDPEQARAHWQAYLQTLHGAPVPTVTYFVVTRTPLVDALVQRWSAVLGVQVALDYYHGTLQTLQSTVIPSGDNLATFSWLADYPDPRDYLSNLWLPGSVGERFYGNFGIDVPSADALMEQADGNPNPTQRAQQYAIAEQLLIDEMAWCPLLQSVAHYEVRPWVHGWVVGAEGLPPNDAWAAMYITSH
jgi:oligopeptide transport system substrate-binding protein